MRFDVDLHGGRLLGGPHKPARRFRADALDAGWGEQLGPRWHPVLDVATYQPRPGAEFQLRSTGGGVTSLPAHLRPVAWSNGGRTLLVLRTMVPNEWDGRLEEPSGTGAPLEAWEVRL